MVNNTLSTSTANPVIQSVTYKGGTKGIVKVEVSPSFKDKVHFICSDCDNTAVASMSISELKELIKLLNNLI
jgi:hypothetical protein